MFRWIDRSPLLARLFERITAALARQTGLLAIIGLLLIIISFIIHLISLALPHPALDLAWSITHHLGIIIAIIGILLVEPLGR